MTGARVVVLAACALAALAAAGCESSQEKSDKLAAKGTQAFREKGLEVKRQNPDVKVVGAAVVQDENGAAVVVQLRNTSSRPLAGVPVAIDVRNAKRASIFKNNEPGLETSLVSVPLLEPGQETVWVHDQVIATGRAKSVAAEAGSTSKPAPSKIPEIALTESRLAVDASSGIEATGKVENKSDVEQRALVISAVASKGGRVVAAGRGQIERLKPGKRATFHIFFIGDPKGAQLTLAVPPTILQ